MSPINRADIDKQYTALLQHGVVADLSSRTRIRVTGSDRVGFLHGFCTADIKKLSPLAGCEAFFTNHQGKAVGHGYLYSREQSLIIDTTAGQFEKLSEHLRRFAITEDVEFADETQSTCELLLAGPTAPATIEQLFRIAAPKERLESVRVSSSEMSLEIVKTDLIPETAYLLLAPTASKQMLLDLLTTAGVALASGELIEALRIEGKTPVYGLEIDETTLPQEMNRDTLAISFKKGCYLGQETVARIDALGHVNRVLTKLSLPGEIAPPTGTPLVMRDETGTEKQVGSIASIAYSPVTKQLTALAVLRRSGAKTGTQLTASNVAAVVS